MSCCCPRKEATSVRNKTSIKLATASAEQKTWRPWILYTISRVLALAAYILTGALLYFSIKETILYIIALVVALLSCMDSAYAAITAIHKQKAGTSLNWLWYAELVLVTGVVASLGVDIAFKRKYRVPIALALLFLGLRIYVRSLFFSSYLEQIRTGGHPSERVSITLIIWKACKVLFNQKIRLLMLFFFVAVTSSQFSWVSYSFSVALGDFQQGKESLNSSTIISLTLSIVVPFFSMLGTVWVASLLFAQGTTDLQTLFSKRAMELEPPTKDLDASKEAVTSNFSQGIAKVQSIWQTLLWNFFSALLKLVVTLGFIGSVSVPAMLAIASTLPIIVSIQVVKRWADSASKEYYYLLTKLESIVANYIDLRQSTMLYNAVPFLENKWTVFNDENKVQRKLGSSFFLASCLQLLYVTLVTLVYVWSIFDILLSLKSGQLNYQEAVAFFGYVTGIIGPVDSVANLYNKVVWAAGPITAVYSLAYPLNEKNEERKDNGLCIVVDESTEKIQQNGTIEVDDLRLQFPKASSPVLKQASFKIESGRFVCLVGASGAGKSTLLRYLAGLDQGNFVSGKVLVNGVHPLQAQDACFVLQAFEVFDGSIRDNIGFGDVGIAGEEDIVAAAKASELHDFIEALPEKYESIIGAHSSLKLSGGQLTRLGLARALCRKPKILLLDEVTSGLDVKVEAKILETLNTLNNNEGITIILCTHSLFATKISNEIIVLDNGRLEEQGTYEELIDKHAMFWDLMSPELEDQMNE